MVVWHFLVLLLFKIGEVRLAPARLNLDLADPTSVSDQNNATLLDKDDVPEIRSDNGTQVDVGDQIKVDNSDLQTKPSVIENEAKEIKNTSKVDELVELIDKEMDVKMEEIEILMEINAIDLLESELKNLDNFQSESNTSEHVEIILVQDGKVFPDVAANEMLELLDNDIDMFEEMKQKVNLLELQMRKKADLHLFKQGSSGQIEAAEIILETLTPFEENLEAVKEYIIKLDHKLDNSTADFVKEFVVRADNFLKKAQQSLKIVEEADEKWDNKEDMIKINLTRKSDQTESNENFVNEPKPLTKKDEESVPIAESDENEDNLMLESEETEMDKIVEGNMPDGWPGIMGGEVLKQNSIKLLENVESDSIPKVDVNGDEAINDNRVELVESKGPEENEIHTERNYSPKFKPFVVNPDKESHQHLHEKARNDQEETGAGWLKTSPWNVLRYFGWFLVIGTGVLLLAMLTCWLVGKIVLKNNAYIVSYGGFHKANNRKYQTHRNC